MTFKSATALTNLYPINRSWSDFPTMLDAAIATLPAGSVVIEIGGGANPSLTAAQVEGLDYIVIDVSAVELAKAQGVHFTSVVADITSDNTGLNADFVFTRMLLEHIPNPEAFHKAIYTILRPGGRALHFYATLYSPASLANWIFPEVLSRWALFLVQRRVWHTEGKFPAYYRWSFGPTRRQKDRWHTVGFAIEVFNGYIGSGYLQRFLLIRYIERAYNDMALKLASAFLCSNAIVLLRKL